MAAIGDHNNHPNATAESSQKPCGLLELPPELRNNIYELCFEPVDDGGHTSFTATTPPELAILQTCRQIHDEANQIYRVAEREYWSNTHFWVEENTYAQALAGAKFLHPKKIGLMNKVTIAVPIKGNPSMYYLTREPKSWETAWPDPLDPERDVIVLRKTQEMQKRLDKRELLDVLTTLDAV
ncbi:hypothetical protein KC343_g15005 [Hortaea werneckii]|uniref:Uncharacterized protein n=1 Tax=Hortaea werneckii TaxID=91943 RepID=A0A3M7EXM8_HORWE|nr:hypothetical protein KC352_g27244 [Hortaea werneckii]KAI7547677.1 hypothetical protein KC317_g15057 [Hortaea werneckii]KAI7596971.1 hypothetical protein KC346_g14900 [Hortaea werneckii]KAI7602065.1 hypothetical protein KC343_g15005 [Hortaea werneckii]KAI7638658.1 hypothetical protein KC319_g14765 [Hortaea werneckii]